MLQQTTVPVFSHNLHSTTEVQVEAFDLTSLAWECDDVNLWLLSSKHAPHLALWPSAPGIPHRSPVSSKVVVSSTRMNLKLSRNVPLNNDGGASPQQNIRHGRLSPDVTAVVPEEPQNDFRGA